MTGKLKKFNDSGTLKFLQGLVKPGKKIIDKETGADIAVTAEGQAELAASLEGMRVIIDRGQVAMLELGKCAADIEKNRGYIQAGFESAGPFFEKLFPDVSTRTLQTVMRLVRRWKFLSRDEIETVIPLGSKKLEFLSHLEDKEIEDIKSAAHCERLEKENSFKIFGKKFTFDSLCSIRLDDLKSLALKALTGDGPSSSGGGGTDPRAEVQLAFESLTDHFWPAFEDLTRVKKYFKKLDPSDRKELSKQLRGMAKQIADAAREVEGKKK